jgi:hypothetical protein
MTVEDIFSRFDEKTVTITGELRKFLLAELKGIIEIPDNSVNLIGYGYGAGYKDLICTILLSKQGVKLGFNKGSELPDPQKLLTGTGRVHCFIEIKTAETIKDPALKKLLSEALNAYQKRKNK